ncbi:glycine-rich protein [Vallitalea guaymasensis]|uniref:glycine-rich protein n=1 Tax=Vallitalea guaymasensis TaxID=1185412 RepID=UPI000DE4E778|nr:glycine-rich protein [Vallitalea guaymasensis]
MKNKVLTFVLIIALIISIPPQHTFASGAHGDNDSIPGGGWPGKGGGIYSTPSFRVGLISEKFRKPLNFDETSNDFISIHEQIDYNFTNHFPKIEHSIIFSPAIIFDDIKNDKSDLMLRKYNASSMGLDNIYSPKDKNNYVNEYINFMKYKVIKIDNYNYTETNNLFYSKLESECSNKRLQDLSDGKWLDILVNTDVNVVEESYKVWNNIFKDWQSNNAKNKFHNKLNLFTHYKGNKEITDDDKFENELGYLQLLMTLYCISLPEEQKDIYNEIERYIRKDEVNITPPIIAIDTVVKVTYPSFSSKKILMTSLDYMMFVTGVTEQNNFTSPTAPTFDDKPWDKEYDLTRSIIKNLVDKSIEDIKTWNRITDIPANSTAFKENGFAWGQAGVIGRSSRLYTGNDVADWRTTSRPITGIMEALKFNDNQYGFMLVSAEHIFSDSLNPTGGFSITTDPPPEEQVKGENPTVLGDVIKISLKGNINNQEEKEWTNVLNRDNFEAGYPKIKIGLEVKMPTESNYVNALNTPYPLTPLNKYPCTNQPQYIKRNDLLNFIKGDPLIYIHELMDYKVKASSIYNFKYRAGIEVQLSKDKEPIILTANPSSEAEKTFSTPDRKKSFYSIPTYASEIKQGSIYHESFEAMAGTPTTRDLYFATGGSEFIAEIKFKHKVDQKAVRTYRSKFSGTSCEFKTGDQAGNYTVPSPLGAKNSDTSVNVHGGDLTISATWTGSLPWTGSVSYWDHGTSVTNSWNYSNYETAKSQAQDWISTINNYEISHTSASDKETRTFKNWNAHITTDSRNDGPSGDADPGQEYIAPTPPSGDPPTGGDDGQDYIAASGHDGGPGNYTITVTGSIPAHILCGPCHNHELPAVEDTWKQEISYDTVEITDVNVWKIQRSKLNGMYTLLGTDEVTADIIQGDPNIFYNIAKTEDSKGGRIRYTLEPQQHDTVVWDEGTRTNKCDGKGSSPYVSGNGHGSDYAKGILYTNSSYSNQENYHQLNSDTIDKATFEYDKFNYRREMENTAKIISDFVILQTSSGDQSLLYFDKDSITIESQQQFEPVNITFEEMLDENPESCVEWEPEQINVGSYNGEFLSPKTKYNGTGDKHKTNTIFDNDPANTIIRPKRPTKPLRIAVSSLDVIDTLSNGEYITGSSSVFYKNILNIGNQFHYHDKYVPEYNDYGLKYGTKYKDSDEFTKINDIVIHNPVSAENAMIYPVDEALDQRVYNNDIPIGGNIQSDIIEYITKLKANHPYQDFIINGDAEDLSPDGNIVNWIGETNNRKDVIFKRIETNAKISGKGSFYIEVPAKSNRLAKYVTSSLGEPNINYTFTGKIKCHNCYGNFFIEALDCNENILKTWTSKTYSNSQLETINIPFNSPDNTAKLRVSIINGDSNNIDDSTEYVIADNLSIIKENGNTSEWVPNKYTIYETREMNNPDYVNPYTIENPEYIPERIEKNPNYIPPINVPQQNIYSGSYTFQNPALVNVNLYGAGGGYYQHVNHTKYYTNSQCGNGNINVNAGDVLKWNGNNLYKNNNIIASYRQGTTGGHTADSCADAERLARNNGGSVSNYSLSNFTYSGSSSNYFIVPAYNQPGNGEPEYNTIPAVGEPTILINNANYKPAIVTNETLSMTFNATSSGSNGLNTNNSINTSNETITMNSGKYLWTVPTTNTYTISAYGAQGGFGAREGGKGAIMTGDFQLTKGQVIEILVGQQGLRHDEGAGGGGGTFVVSHSNQNALIVAGGGGGGAGNNPFDEGKDASYLTSPIDKTHGGSYDYGHSNEKGGGGGGFIGDAHPSYGGKSFSNGGAGYSNHGGFGGGGGGGYYGGNGNDNGGGYGGGSYNTGTNQNNSIGNTGHGKVIISTKTGIKVITPAQGTPYIKDLSPTLISVIKTDKTVSQPPEDWYETIIKTIPANPNIELPNGEHASSGDMLMLDYPFKVYFPNVGDFYEDGSLGLAETSKHRGKGFIDDMDTTEWTSKKIAKFDFNVIYNDNLYPSGSEISLYPIDQDWYHFYLPLANKEAVSAKAEFYSVATNGSGIDNNYPTNKKRYINMNARHSALRKYNTDIVGRIGNLVMEDTGDFRFSNLFKQPIYPTEWYIPNVIPKVQIDKQNNYIGSTTDIRGECASSTTNYLNTYGCLDFLQKAPLSFPLSPSNNNIEALKRQPLRLGYPIFMDIQTIGNYYSYMQITPYYYALDLLTGKITSLDVYMNVDGKYQPINIFDGKESVYNYPVTLNWEEESLRRNYTEDEKNITEFVRDNTYNANSEGYYVPIGMPIGKYHTYGNAQFMQLNERNRTFIGTPYTYGMNRNPGNLLSDYAYNQQAQRWHFTFKLPSSAIFVPHGSKITNSNLKQMMNDSTVVIAAANIKAIGDTYCLQYKHHEGNGSITLAGKTHSLDSIPYSVYAVYSSEKSSSDDLSTSGTH